MLTPKCCHRVAQGRTWTGTPGLSKGGILVPWGHCDRSLPAGVLTRIYLHHSGGRVSKTKGQQGWAPAEALGISLPPSAPGGSRCPLVCGCRARSPPPPSQGRLFFLSLISGCTGPSASVHWLSLVGVSRGSSFATECGL